MRRVTAAPEVPIVAVGNRLPFLYALQFSPDDKVQAMSLAQLMADLEPGPQERMGFMFCPRFDTLVDTRTEAMVREKFPDTKIYQCRNRVTGWPKAPNAMMHEVYSLFHQQTFMQRTDQWQYCAILMGEPDCVPLAKDWIKQLQDEWYECDWKWPLGNNQYVLGHWLTRDNSTCGIPHINGNCMISPGFLHAYPAFRTTTLGSWDTTHSRAMLTYGRPSKKIFSSYALGRDPKNPWLGCEDLWKTRYMTGSNPIAGEPLNPVYLHGVKDQRAQECVRNKLITQ